MWTAPLYCANELVQYDGGEVVEDPSLKATVNSGSPKEWNIGGWTPYATNF